MDGKDGVDANLGNRHYATYGLFYKREAAWWTSCLLPAKYSRLNFDVRNYTNPMFVHLLFTNVFRNRNTPNDRAQRKQIYTERVKLPKRANLLSVSWTGRSVAPRDIVHSMRETRSFAAQTPGSYLLNLPRMQPSNRDRKQIL